MTHFRASLMRVQYRFVFAIAFLILLSGCFLGFQGIQGSGIKTKVTRTLPAFRELSASNSITVDVTIGDELRVEVEGDDNLVPLVATHVHNGELVVKVDGGYSTNIGLKVLIQTPELEKASAANASHIVLRGKLPQIELTAANAANIDGENLEVQRATVSAANAAHIVIHAVERISGNASNASSVEYVGECKDVDVETSNASSLSAKE